MRLVLTIGVVVAWVICGVFAYAFELAYWQRAYPDLAKDSYKSDRIVSAVFALFGPIALVFAIAWGRWLGIRSRKGGYGLKWR